MKCKQASFRRYRVKFGAGYFMNNTCMDLVNFAKKSRFDVSAKICVGPTMCVQKKNYQITINIIFLRY